MFQVVSRGRFIANIPHKIVYWQQLSACLPCRVGWILFLYYLGALGFYLYVRITKTLDLGVFTFYGAAPVKPNHNNPTLDF